MRNFAYLQIDENMTPRDMGEFLQTAKNAGFEDIIIIHPDNCDIYNTAYREKILTLLRRAYKVKVKIYIYDDAPGRYGTGFGGVPSVRDVWEKVLTVKKSSEILNNEEILDRRNGRCIVAELAEPDDSIPYGHYVDLTKKDCAFMVIDYVYKPLVKEFAKFAGYEFAGFVCNMPRGRKGSGICHSKEASEKFLNRHKRMPSLFAVFEGGEERDWYDEAIDEAIDEAFIDPIRKYCGENNLEFICNRGEHITAGGKSFKADVSSVGEAQAAFLKGQGVVVKITPGMGHISRLGDFFDSHKDYEKADVHSLRNLKGDKYIIGNGKDRPCSVCIIPRGEWYIEDWEKNIVYDLDKHMTYTIYPGSFLCIRRRNEDIYTDNLPVRIGGVTAGDWTKEKKLPCKGEDTVTFTLPEKNLNGKCVEFKAECEILQVKMGYNAYEFVTKPYIVPAYDFLCGSQCQCRAIGGKVKEINIINKMEL